MRSILTAARRTHKPLERFSGSGVCSARLLGRGLGSRNGLPFRRLLHRRHSHIAALDSGRSDDPTSPFDFVGKGSIIGRFMNQQEANGLHQMREYETSFGKSDIGFSCQQENP